MSLRRPVVLLLLLGPVFLAGCSTSELAYQAFGSKGPDRDQLVEEARKAGLTPYWLGESFEINGKQAEAGSGKFYGPDHPQLVIHYFLEHGANGRVSIQTFSAAQGGGERILRGARTLAGLSVELKDVGPWPGELWVAPLGTRPTNWVTYVLQINGTEVLATAKSASTGVPGTDVNPLIDAELWGQILEEHLQPYPE